MAPRLHSLGAVAPVAASSAAALALLLALPLLCFLSLAAAASVGGQVEASSPDAGAGRCPPALGERGGEAIAELGDGDAAAIGSALEPDHEEDLTVCLMQLRLGLTDPMQRATAKSQQEAPVNIAAHVQGELVQAVAGQAADLGRAKAALERSDAAASEIAIRKAALERSDSAASEIAIRKAALERSDASASEIAIRKVSLATCAILIVLVLATFSCRLFDPSAGLEDGRLVQERASGGSEALVFNRRWQLIIASGFVQLIAGSVYGMGAWMDSLRDALGLTMGQVSTVNSATFLGALAAYLGGKAFDTYGARLCVASGGAMCTTGYVLILAAVVSNTAPAMVRLALASTGALFAGYSSVCLLDNIVCMACSLSFPSDRAAVVGYLKANVGISGGVWAMLWVTLFRRADGLGLPAFLAFTAVVSLFVTAVALIPMGVLPEGPARQPFDGGEMRRYAGLVVATVTLSVFNVGVSFLFSSKAITPSPSLGITDLVLASAPLLVLLLPSSPRVDSDAKVTAASADGRSVDAVKAMKELDFWLLFFIQFVIFGAGVGTNQNIALILESIGMRESAGLGVALFALSSAVSRMAVGVLSDRYNHRFSRFNWLQVVAACGIGSQLLVSCMSFAAVIFGVFLAGLSFGMFYTVIVPVVNEMYGRRQFGAIMATQLSSQAIASLLVCKALMPAIYARAAGGALVCEGAACFRPSFLILAGLSITGFMASCVLEHRNRNTLPVDRLSSD